MGETVNGMPTWKKWLISIVSILVLGCIIVDAWYLILKFFGKEVIVSSTVEVGDVVLADGESKDFCEVALWKNAANDGLEMFEVKFNYLLDEERTAFYSQGLQYVGASEVNSLEWTPVQKSEYDINISQGGWWGGAIWTTKNWHFNWGEYTLKNGAMRYNYQSSDDYVHTTGATNPIADDSMFKITLGKSGSEEIYGVKFKANRQNERGTGDKLSQVDYIMEHNEKFEYGHKSKKENSGFYQEKNYTYSYELVNVDYFAKKIYDSVKGMSTGTASNIVFEWGDLFDYFKCTDEKSGRYEAVAQDAENSDLLSSEIKSYYSIKVTIHDEGAKRAEDSLFNCIHGSDTYNLTGDYTDKEFFYGENLVKADIFDFDLVRVGGNEYALKLKQTFLDENLDYADEMFLLIEIDLDELSKENMEFYGFTKDSGLEKFKIYKIYTLKTVQGSVQRTEVKYA